MREPEWDFESPTDSDEHDVALPKSPEKRVDQYGVRTALFVLAVAFFIAAMWIISSPSFEKCSALENVAERNACFDTLRNDLLKPPAKVQIFPKARSKTNMIPFVIAVLTPSFRFRAIRRKIWNMARIPTSL